MTASIQSPNRLARIALALEGGVGTLLILTLAALPFIAALFRLFVIQLPYTHDLLASVPIMITFLGMALASKDGNHLGISLTFHSSKTTLGYVSRTIRSFAIGLILGVFGLASLDFMAVNLATTVDFYVWFVPLFLFLIAYPLGLITVAVREFRRSPERLAKILFVVGLVIGVLLSFPALRSAIAQFTMPTDIDQAGQIKTDLQSFFASWNGMVGKIAPFFIIVLIVGAAAGTPLFCVLGGLGFFLYSMVDGIDRPAVQILDSGYKFLTGSDVAAIVLFTVVGFMLSESGAAGRFVHLFRGLFGKFKGGVVIVTILVSAIFTCFTGATGVTILAMGALLYGMLTKSGGNTESFSVGIITGAGVIGLLFPPSLAIILLGSISQTSILNLFFAGIVPGLLFVTGMIIVGIILSRRDRKLNKALEDRGDVPTAKETRKALLDTSGEIFLLVLILFLCFTMKTNLVETAAIAAVWAIILEVFIKRAFTFKTFLATCAKALGVIGGILGILAFARGLGDYFVDAGLDQSLATWAMHTFQSPLLFLLMLNLILFVVGCLMDLFSAMTIFVPLLLPVAVQFGISPVHFDIIFLANLAVGYLTPPIGMDLFLAAYQFKRPMVKIFRDILPWLFVQIVVVFLITYLPFLTTGLPELISGAKV